MYQNDWSGSSIINLQTTPIILIHAVLSLMEHLFNNLAYFSLRSEIHNKFTINKQVSIFPTRKLVTISKECQLYDYKVFYQVTKLDS